MNSMISAERKQQEKRLYKLCKQSENLDYDNLIKRLQEITENNINIDSYQFIYYIKWLTDELTDAEVINPVWDLSYKKIKEKYNDEYYKKNLEEMKNNDNIDCWNNWQEFKDDVEFWFKENSIDGIFEDIKRDYEKTITGDSGLDDIMDILIHQKEYQEVLDEMQK